jgi:putative peptide zinc metalloprotease protein
MDRRALAALAGAFALAGAAATPAAAAGVPQGGGANDVVLATTSTDGGFTAKAHTKVTTTDGISVAPSNVAVARAESCTACHASAVAVQAVIFAGSPRVYTPTNAAVAANGNCTSCGTYAYAWQYLVQVDRDFTLSGDARQQIHDLSTQIDDVASSVVPASLDADALLDLELNGLTAQLETVIDHEVAAAGAHLTDAPIERMDHERR